MSSPSLGERSFAKLSDVLAVMQQWIARQKSFQNLFVLKQRLFAKVITLREKQVENDVQQSRLFIERVMQKLKA